MIPKRVILLRVCEGNWTVMTLEDIVHERVRVPAKSTQEVVLVRVNWEGIVMIR